jgi:hypothetical protein
VLDEPYVAAATEGGFLMTCSLPQRERSVAYNLTVDQYVNAIGAHAERTRTQIVDVLAAINPEVRAGIRGPAVNRLVDGSNHSASRSRDSDSGWRQVASRHTIQHESELHRNNPASNVEHARSIGIDRLLNLRSISWR